MHKFAVKEVVMILDDVCNIDSVVKQRTCVSVERVWRGKAQVGICAGRLRVVPSARLDTAQLLQSPSLDHIVSHNVHLDAFFWLG
jgi:hypothetical protein